jgi:hypothetical protein
MVTMEDVRAAIDPDEPDYDGAALRLGEEALPFLRELAAGTDTMLASKAVSLAGTIGGEQAVAVVDEAARAHPQELRVVAAAAAGRLGADGHGVLADLLADGDAGVRKYALRAVPSDTADLSGPIREALETIRAADSDPGNRERATDILSDG